MMSSPGSPSKSKSTGLGGSALVDMGLLAGIVGTRNQPIAVAENVGLLDGWGGLGGAVCGIRERRGRAREWWNLEEGGVEERRKKR